MIDRSKARPIEKQLANAIGELVSSYMTNPDMNITGAEVVDALKVNLEAAEDANQMILKLVQGTRLEKLGKEVVVGKSGGES